MSELLARARIAGGAAATTGSDAAGVPPALSPRQQWWIVAVLTTLSMLAMLDKNLIQLMVTPIRHDLGLTDVQISLVIGAAFAVANIAAGLPAGWLADRISRRGLVGTGVIVWSLATASSGVARSFGGLFAARAAVGVGEGIIPPSCYSLLRDGVEPGKRGRALAIYSTAQTAGAGIALVVAGALIGAIAARGIDRLPLVGPIHPWQLALAIIGILGLPVTLLVLTLPRVGRARAAARPEESSFADAIRFVLARWPVFLPLLIYSVSHAMLMAVMGSWMPALIGRKFGLAPQQLGPILGVLLILCGPGGLAVVGVLIDRLHRAGRPGAAMVGVWGAAVFALAGAIMPQLASLDAFWPVETLVLLSTTPFLVVTAAIVSEQAPPHMVGKLMAMFLFVQGLAGQALSPTLAALLSDRVFRGQANALGNAITTSAIIYGGVGFAMAVLLWWNLRRRTVRQAVAA